MDSSASGLTSQEKRQSSQLTGMMFRLIRKGGSAFYNPLNRLRLTMMLLIAFLEVKDYRLM